MSKEKRIKRFKSSDLRLLFFIRCKYVHKHVNIINQINKHLPVIHINKMIYSEYIVYKIFRNDSIV